MPDPVNLLFALPGAGATVASRCLGAMKNVVVLSEIHPRGLAEHNPLEQADLWFGLITDADRADLRTRTDWDYLDVIKLIAERARDGRKKLVIRDRSALDFLGGEGIETPWGQFLHREVLERDFAPRAAALVRHPIDQWLSLQHRAPYDLMTLGTFLRGYRRYAECLEGVETVKYEAFVAEPDAALRRLCQTFDMTFDPGWRSGWRAITRVTGDISPETMARTEIAATPRRPMTEADLDPFIQSADYLRGIELLGYAHPG